MEMSHSYQNITSSFPSSYDYKRFNYNYHTNNNNNNNNNNIDNINELDILPKTQNHHTTVQHVVNRKNDDNDETDSLDSMEFFDTWTAEPYNNETLIDDRLISNDNNIDENENKNNKSNDSIKHNSSSYLPFSQNGHSTSKLSSVHSKIINNNNDNDNDNDNDNTIINDSLNNHSTKQIHNIPSSKHYSSITEKQTDSFRKPKYLYQNHYEDERMGDKDASIEGYNSDGIHNYDNIENRNGIMDDIDYNIHNFNRNGLKNQFEDDNIGIVKFNKNNDSKNNTSNNNNNNSNNKQNNLKSNSLNSSSKSFQNTDRKYQDSSNSSKHRSSIELDSDSKSKKLKSTQESRSSYDTSGTKRHDKVIYAVNNDGTRVPIMLVPSKYNSNNRFASDLAPKALEFNDQDFHDHELFNEDMKYRDNRHSIYNNNEKYFNDINQLKQQIQQLQQKITEYEKLFSNVNHDLEDLNTLRNENQFLKKKNSEYMDQLQRVKNESRRADELQDHIHRMNQETLPQLKDLESENERLYKIVVAQENKLKKLNQSLYETQNHSTSNENHLRQQIKQLIQEKDKLSNALNQSYNAHEQFKQDALKVLHQIRSSSSNTASPADSDTPANNDDWETVWQTLRSEMMMLRRRNVELAKQVMHTKETESEMQENMAHQKQMMQETMREAQKTANNQAEERWKENVAQLRSEIHELNAKLKIADMKRKQAEERRSEKEKENESLFKELRQVKKELQSLKDEEHRKTRSTKQKEKEISAERERMREEIKSLQNQLQKESTRSSQAVREASEKDSKTQQLSRQFRKLQEQLDTEQRKSMETINNLQQEIQEYKSKIRSDNNSLNYSSQHNIAGMVNEQLELLTQKLQSQNIDVTFSPSNQTLHLDNRAVKVVLRNGSLLVRVGGGYVELTEFISRYCADKKTRRSTGSKSQEGYPNEHHPDESHSSQNENIEDTLQQQLQNTQQ